MNIHDEIVEIGHHVKAKTSHGEKLIDADSKQKVLGYLDELAPEIDTVLESSSATMLEIAQTCIIVTDGYSSSKQDRDILLEKAKRYIVELYPTVYELAWAERKLVCERQDRRNEGQFKEFIPTFQEIREVVKQAKRNTILLQARITNIHRQMDGQRPFAIPFCDTEDELLELITNPPELPQLASRELPQLEAPELPQKEPSTATGATKFYDIFGQ